MSKYIMAIDEGTTGTRVLLLNHAADLVGQAYSEFPQIYPKPGWVEHNPSIIWATTLELIKQTLNETDAKPAEITGIGITNQRETCLLWDRRTLEPVHNAIVWQCRRSAGICDELKNRGLEPTFRSKTGLVLDAYFSGTKLKWIFDAHPALKDRAKRGELAFGTIDTWLIARLTGGKVHATDHTNASRTLLYNIHERCWDAELLELLDIPAQILPKVVNSAEVVGFTDSDLFGAAIPIAGIAGDQQAALCGQGCFYPGQAKNSYGTGCFLLRNMGTAPVTPPQGLLLTLACTETGAPCYALEGSVFMAGATIQWLRDGLGIITNAAETQAIAASVPDTGGVYMVPAFAGLGAPYWDMYARAAIQGLSRASSRAHIVRAALEGIAYQIKDLAGAFNQAAGHDFNELRVDGGACKNDFLMQFQADVLGCPVDRARQVESTGIGAAYLAGIATGFWQPGEEISKLRKTDRIFCPQISDGQRQELYSGWQDAVRRIRSDF